VAGAKAPTRGPPMDFRILGPLEVQGAGGALSLGGAKQRALLAALLLRANEVVSSDRLIEELWGEHPPETGGKALQVRISELRKLLEPDRGRGEPNRVLLTRPPGYLLRLEPEQLDLTRFERLCSEARDALARGEAARARTKLEEALALWRGGALADLAYEPFAQAEIARLNELRLAALEDRIDADLALGRHADVVGELESLIAEQPLRERLRRQLMLALYRSGRQAEALEAYRQTRNVLVEELGIEPGRGLKELERAILIQDSSLDLDVRIHPNGAAAPTEEAVAAEPEGDNVSPGERSFVGREGELATFVEGLERALAGEASLFLVAGEPGIGKSRLVDEIASRARKRGAKVVWGRCWEAGGAPAYWPWVQALRTYIRDSDPELVRRALGAGAADVAQILPELGELIPDLPAPPSLDPEGARFRVFDATASFLRAASEAQPLMLALDDLHAADAPSLLLLRFLARELREARIVLAGTFRDSESAADDALAEAVSELRREPITHIVQLGGLALPELARFIEQITGAQPSERLGVAIHRETEGNPLFVGELVRLLASEGRLEEAEGPEWEPSIPLGLREVIGHRLRHLSDDCKRLLSVASVLGREVRLDVLERVSEHSGEELLDSLEEAFAAGVVTELPAYPGGLRFSHALIRDSLYGDLGTKDRLGLHRRAGAVLETLYGQDPESHLTELAHHFLKAAPGGDLDQAIEYARRAGERAAELLAYEEAARLYEMALEVLELKMPPDERIRCELMLALGDAQARAGDLTSAKETFLDAADVARRLNAPNELARAALGYGGRFVWFRAGKDRRLIPLLEDALKALPTDSPLRARLLARLAGALRDHPIPTRRSVLSREAVVIARRLGDRATLAYALEGTYAALSWPRDAQAWLAMARELAQLAEETGDWEQAFSAHFHAFGALMVRADVRAADAELAGMAALAQELRQPAQVWSLSIARGMRALLAGRIEEAERLVHEFAGVGPGGQGSDATDFYYVLNLQSWAVRREQGRLTDVEPSLVSFVEEYPNLFLFRSLLASLYAELGRAEEAREELARLAADDFADLQVGTEWFLAASLLAGVCTSLGDAPRAARLYDALLPYPDCNVYAHPEVSLGSASRVLGMLASTMHRWKEASRHFERALKMNARMGALPCVAHTQDDYARMLLSRGEPGDRETAFELTQKALATYRELGMESWAERASSLEEALTRGG
jgi:DNA-binding SARP family transcriptional activator